MAKYSDIKGFTVQTVSTDPAASVVDSGSWSSTANMNTARSQVDGCGIITAALATGGYTTTNVANTESWNGSAWSEVNNLNASTRDKAVFGTYTAAIAAGGNPPSTNNESWDGTNWTEVNEINTARGGAKAVGTNTAGLIYGGYATARSALTESWDGTNFTEVGDLNTARAGIAGAGTQTAALAATGGPNAAIGAASNDTESWNGSAWTTLTESSNTNIQGEGAGSCGTQTDALLFGGSIYDSSGPSARTEAWNGSTWTEVADLGTGRARGAESGTGSTSAMIGGGGPPNTTATEQWTTTPSALFQKTAEGQLFFNSTANAFKETIKDIPGATWSSGGNLNTARRWGGQGVLGIQTATLLCGGATPPGNQANTEQYNGTSWTEVNDLNAANGACMCWGTTTSAINCGGAPPRKQVESWDGTSWTETTDFNNPRYGGLGAGSSNTSGIIFGGENPSPGGPHPGPYFSATEVWDGSSWTEVNEMNQARYGMLGGGAIYTAAIGAGGADPVPSYAALTEIWDGTSWTEVSDMNEKRMTGVGFGITTSLIATGSDPQGDPPRASTELWDGTSWSQLTATISTDNKSQMSSGGANAATGVIFGGRTPPSNVQSSTEEWTADLSNKTITSS